MTGIRVSILTGGADRPYALGLLGALIAKGMSVDFIGSDEMSTAELLSHERVNFLNYRGDQSPQASALQKAARVLRYYWRLLRYVTTTDSVIFHILWLNKFVLVDRTVLIIYYKVLGKKVTFTAHNVNERERDGGDDIFNRVSLRIMYHLVDHIFVHTTQNRSQLIRDFRVPETKVSVIPFGINNTLKNSCLTSSEAKNKLQLKDHEKIVLFFGNIAPYKGLEYAIAALDMLRKTDDTYRMVICGQIKACQEYWKNIEEKIKGLDLDRYLLKMIHYIPDEDVEIFFKAADVLVLPYKFIFQSGVLFLSYNFGLPVIASDVGSLKEEIVEGETGMICRPEDPDDLAANIRRYFDSEMFRNLEQVRAKIIKYGNTKYSWEKVGNITSAVYENLVNKF